VETWRDVTGPDGVRRAPARDSFMNCVPRHDNGHPAGRARGWRHDDLHHPMCHHVQGCAERYVDRLVLSARHAGDLVGLDHVLLLQPVAAPVRPPFGHRLQLRSVIAMSFHMTFVDPPHTP
jgi:hypothetical protein